MLIDEVILRNFRSHENTHILFKVNEGENITVIVGDNGAGKTSILDGISFALFKSKPTGVGVDELITLGEVVGEVSLSFHSNGREYRVHRRRSVKGGAESFFYEVNEGGETLVAMREKEVTKEIEEVLGINGELFTNAVYIKQGEIDRLFTDDPAKRKKHIGKLIGIEDIENTYQNFFHLLNNYDLKIEKLDGVSDNLEEKKEIKKRESKELKTYKSELSEAENHLDSQKNLVGGLEQRIDTLDGLKALVEKEKNLAMELLYLKERIKKIDEFEEQLKDTKKDKIRANAIEKEIEALNEKINELNLLAELKSRSESELKKEEGKTDSLRTELQNILGLGASVLGVKINDIASLELIKNKALADLEKDFWESEKNREKTLKAIAEKNASLVFLNKALIDISDAEGTCPVCGQDLTSSHRRKLIKNYSRDISVFEKSIATWSKELEKIKENSTSINKRRDVLSALNTEMYREINRQLTERLIKTQSLEAAVKKDESALKDLPHLFKISDSIKKELLALKLSRDRYNAALNYLRKEQPEKENTVSKILSVENRIKSIKRTVSSTAKKADVDLDILLPAYEALKSELKTAQNNHIVLERKAASIHSTIEYKKRRILELRNEIKTLEVLQNECRSLKDFKVFLEKIRFVFHKDALQKELRKRVRPLIEEYTREVFLSFNLPYSDLTLTDDYSITVHGVNGEESVDMLSGGERIAAALALRVGLSRALAGQRLELLILDEPTIHLDQPRRRELVEIVRNLSIIPQSIVVTHDKEFEEAADRVIEVEKVNGVSVVR
jgi:exonuclease SbcC